MMTKELDTLKLKAEALAANIMHKDGYILRDSKGYTFTGAVLYNMIKNALSTADGEERLNNLISALESHLEEVTKGL